MSDKRCLIIAYEFPPAANVGVYRPLKFARYLPEFGWSVAVLTVKGGKFAKYDERMLDLVPPGLPVYRARSVEALNAGENRRVAGVPRRTLRSRIHVRLSEVFNYFAIPDNKVFWIPFAVREGRRAIRREGITHVLATGKPFSAFIVGYLLKRMTGVRLAIDYRDPWTQNPDYRRRSLLHAWTDRKLERAVVRASDLVIANTRVNEEMLVRDFGQDQDRRKFITIHNGFDASDFDQVPAVKDDMFTITYAGVFYFGPGSSFKGGAGDDMMRTYSPLYFFEALKKLGRTRPDVLKSMQVCFMGMLGHGHDTLIKEAGLDGTVKVLGYLGYRQHLEVLRKSHALLLVLSRGEKSRGWVPSKFFSYLGSGNPILAMIPDGEVREIMEKTRAGVVVGPDDVDGTVDALIELYDRHYKAREPFRRNESEVDKFERRRLAFILASALDAC